MKTNLKQQKELVQDIQLMSLVEGIKLLRRWLEQYGYEPPYVCTHYTIVRSTGQCTSCGIFVPAV